jgi:hypothetical protein
MQTVNGSARDTMGNGVGSLVFALVNFGAAALYFRDGLLLPGVLYGICGTGLLVAGLMAILARTDYLDWKAANKGRSSDSYFGKGRRRDRGDD